MALNPEGLFRAFARALGIEPETAQRAVNYLIVQLQTIEGERIAFKSASQQMVAHFNARLDRIESLLAKQKNGETVELIQIEARHDEHDDISTA